MNLDEEKKQKVAAWIREGLKLSDIQKRLDSELGIRMTYMDVRLLVDDLKLVPKDLEPPKAPDLNKTNLTAATGAAEAESYDAGPEALGEGAEGDAPAAGRVSITVDQLARPGALVSGKVTFSDGKSAQWYLDQMGRLGLVPNVNGYKPSPADLQAFQLELQNELARMGF